MKPLTLPPVRHESDPLYTREDYSVAAAAAYLHTSHASIYAEAHAGRIGFRRGSMRRLLFSQADLDAYRESRRHPARPAAAPMGKSRAKAPARTAVLELPKRRVFA